MHAFSSRRAARSLVRSCVLCVLVSIASAHADPRATVVIPAEKPTATRPVERRAVIEGLTEPLQNLRITDLNGRDISAQVRARTEAGKVSLDLAQPSAVVLRSKT